MVLLLHTGHIVWVAPTPVGHVPEGQRLETLSVESGGLYGPTHSPADLIEEATGSPPSPDAFVEYLRDKVERLYGVTA